MAALQYLKIAAFQHLTICGVADRAGNFSGFHTLGTSHAGLAGARLLSNACGWRRSRQPAHEIRPSERVGIGRWDRGQGDLAMDADWLWVMLALGIFIPAGMLPLTFARDACRWWRERRGTRSPDPAYEQGMPCARDDA
jgi:hypothetical protein